MLDARIIVCYHYGLLNVRFSALCVMLCMRLSRYKIQPCFAIVLLT